MARRKSTPSATPQGKERSNAYDEDREEEQPRASAARNRRETGWIKHLILPLLVIAYMAASNYYIGAGEEYSERATRAPASVGQRRFVQQRRRGLDQCTQWKGVQSSNFDDWCQNSCAGGYCPESYCTCAVSEAQPAEGACTKWKGLTSNYDGWCAGNCPGPNCASFCKCDSTAADPTCSGGQRTCPNGQYQAINGQPDTMKYCRQACNAPGATNCQCNICECVPPPKSADGQLNPSVNVYPGTSVNAKLDGSATLVFDQGYGTGIIVTYSDTKPVELTLLDGWEYGGYYSVKVDGEVFKITNDRYKSGAGCFNNYYRCQEDGEPVVLTLPAGTHTLFIERKVHGGYADYYMRFAQSIRPADNICSRGEFTINSEQRTMFSAASCPAGLCIADLKLANLNTANSTLAACGVAQAWVASWNSAPADCLTLVSQEQPAVVVAGTCSRYLPTLCQACSEVDSGASSGVDNFTEVEY